VILRGGKSPNYDAASVAAAASELAKAGLAQRLMIDASHANSQKNAQNQIGVCENVGAQIAGGEERIVGMMVESHLIGGRQDLEPGRPLVYGQSITDACIGWDESTLLLDGLAASVRARRSQKSLNDAA
jgi:3-deoxy-7-phosphoheptulonate synthase